MTGPPRRRLEIELMAGASALHFSQTYSIPADGAQTFAFASALTGQGEDGAVDGTLVVVVELCE